jgi:hypothetical protein
MSILDIPERIKALIEDWEAEIPQVNGIIGRDLQKRIDALRALRDN